MYRMILLGALMMSSLANAQTYPQKPVHVIVPYAAGGASDILARVLGASLQEQWRQPVIVENRVGAGGNIGTDYVAKSAPDGYTLLLGDLSNFVIAPAVYKSIPYDVLKDFTPVITLTYSPYMLLASPGFEPRSLKDTIAYAKAHPGKLNWATTGLGSAPHLAGLQFARLQGLDWVYVPNKGGAQANTDVMGNTADLMFNSMLASMNYVKGGKMRLLAMTSKARHPDFPDTPTVGEVVPGFVAGGWQGLLAPAGTPPAIINKLNADLAAVLKQPEIRQKLIQLGTEPVGNTPAAVQKFVRDEKTRWADLIRDTGLQLDL